MSANNGKSPRVKIAVGLVVVLSASLALNYVLRPSTQRDADLRQNRGLASREDESKFNSDLVKSEHAMAAALQTGDKARGIASYGAKQAGLLETLKITSLKGGLKYHILTDSGRVKSIQFVQNPTSDDRPIRIDSKKVLDDYRDLWAVDFVAAVPDQALGEETSYSLLDASGNPVGKAQFSFTDDREFMSLEFAPVEATK